MKCLANVKINTSSSSKFVPQSLFRLEKNEETKFKDDTRTYLMYLLVLFNKLNVYESCYVLKRT